MAIGIYVIALSYLVIVGFASVIPQVFWPASDDSFDLECGEGLELLHHEVDQVRLEYLKSNETDPTALRNTLSAWDLRLNALAKRCDEEPVELLRRYRYRVELRLEKFMRDDAPLANQVTETIGPEPDTPSPKKGEPTP